MYSGSNRPDGITGPAAHQLRSMHHHVDHVTAAPVVSHQVDRSVDPLELRFEPVTVGEVGRREPVVQRSAEPRWRQPHHVVTCEGIDQRAPDRFGLRVAVHEYDCHVGILARVAAEGGFGPLDGNVAAQSSSREGRQTGVGVRRYAWSRLRKMLTATPVDACDPEDETRVEEARGRIEQAGDPGELGADDGVGLARGQYPDPPWLVSRIDGVRGPSTSGKARSEPAPVPGHADRLGRGAKVAPGQVGNASAQAVSQRHRVHRRDRHSLPVDRVEATYRIAADQQAVGESPHLVVASPLAGRHPVLDHRPDRFAGPHCRQHVGGAYSWAKDSMPSKSRGGSRPTIPKTVNIHVSFSLPTKNIPVGRPGAGLTRASISFSVPGGIRSSWLT